MPGGPRGNRDRRRRRGIDPQGRAPFALCQPQQIALEQVCELRLAAPVARAPRRCRRAWPSPLPRSCSPSHSHFQNRGAVSLPSSRSQSPCIVPLRRRRAPMSIFVPWQALASANKNWIWRSTAEFTSFIDSTPIVRDRPGQDRGHDQPPPSQDRGSTRSADAPQKWVAQSSYPHLLPLMQMGPVAEILQPS